MNTIITRAISKSINDDKILNNISLKLESGKIYGFVGRNGSGKSMLFKVLSGLVKPTDGEIFINEVKVDLEYKIKLRIGIVIENTGLYGDLNGFDNLKYLSKIRGIINDEQIRDAIKRVGLDNENLKPIKKYSLGMKQKIVIAQAIMEEPELLLLDEPTNALDENGIERLRKIVIEEANRGAIVLISSHNPVDINLLCDVIYEMKEGNIFNSNVKENI